MLKIIWRTWTGPPQSIVFHKAEQNDKHAAWGRSPSGSTQRSPITTRGELPRRFTGKNTTRYTASGHVSCMVGRAPDVIARADGKFPARGPCTAQGHTEARHPAEPIVRGLSQEESGFELAVPSLFRSWPGGPREYRLETLSTLALNDPAAPMTS